MSRWSKFQWYKDIAGARRHITYREMCVLLAVAGHADQEGRGSWASFATLAVDADMDERNARAALKALTAKGYLRISARRGRNANGFRKSNTYELIREMPHMVGTDLLASEQVNASADLLASEQVNASADLLASEGRPAHWRA